MTRMVLPTMKILKNTASRSTTNMWANRVPPIPARSNQTRLASTPANPAALRYASRSLGSRGIAKSTVKTTQSQTVNSISGSSRSRSAPESVRVKVIRLPRDE